ncbi:MAG: DUF4476 domain-containing protein [Bacteroidota bacterium]
MKALLTLILGSVMFATFGQTVTLTFRDNNQDKQNRDYRVMIDGYSYNSTEGTKIGSNKGSNGPTAFTITNLSPGAHTINVYSSTASGNILYSNNFQLRRDYDLTIAVNPGRISFSEKFADGVNASNDSRHEMDANAFTQLAQEIKANRYQSSRVAAIREAVSSDNRFTTKQVKELVTLVTAETSRLELAKLAYSSVVDPVNYMDLNTLFTTTANKRSFSAYVQAEINKGNNGNVNIPVPARVLLSDTRYNQLLVSLNNNNYQSGKLAIIRDAFGNTGTAFTTAQIRQLLGVITSENDRLSLAKQAYATVYDPVNFSTLLTMFGSQANRVELNNYIISNGGTGGNIYGQARTPVSDADFSVLLRKANNHLLAWDKATDVRAAFTNPQNYFTSSQARELIGVASAGNILSSVPESTRVELAKLSYSRIVDPENFVQVMDLFTIQASRDEINSYVRRQTQN